MKIYHIALIFSAALLLGCGEPQKDKAKKATTGDIPTDKRLIELILSAKAGDSIISLSRKTDFYILRSECSQDQFDTRVSWIKKGFQSKGYNFNELLDLLVERNQNSATLSINLPSDCGYIFDDSDQFDKYFEEGGGNWTKLREEHPRFFGFKTISLPVFDPASKTVLIYTELTTGFLSGSGMISAFRYDQGEITHLDGIILFKK